VSIRLFETSKKLLLRISLTVFRSMAVVNA